MSLTRKTCLVGLCFVLFETLSFSVYGADLRSIEVWQEGDRYHLISESLIGASQDALYNVLIDYDQFKHFTSAIVASNNVEAGKDGRPRFFTRMRGCVFLYCHTFIRRGYLLLTPKRDIVAVTEPEESDFEFSREQWQLSSEGEDTLMIYQFEMEPSFWLPPYIGPYYLKRVLRSGSIRTIQRIEAIARGERPIP
jgi:hypothetical protein